MELHQYQKNIANFIARHPRCILSVDMGLGKTASTLAWLNWYTKKNRERYGIETTAIIVAPKRVAETVWKQEAEKWGWSIAERMIIVAGTPAKRTKALNDGTHPIKVISRENLADVAGRTVDVLVLDELTSFKSVTATRTKNVMSIHANIRVGLTGTFLANGAIDIYGQAAAVGLEWKGLNFYAWRGSYFKDVLAGSGLQFQKWKLNLPLETLLAPIRDNIYTLTAEDYLDIPEKTEITHAIDIGEETRASIAELDAFLATSIGGQKITFDENQKFAKLQTLCNGFVYDFEGDAVRGKRSVKLEAVADFVASCKESGEPVLLFYAFKEEALWIAELLKARGVRYESVKKSGFLERWNNGEIECLFAHPASAGHGLNLQHGGRIIVWSTLTYNYELFAQGNARLARQGQKHNVQIHYFVADKTCEQRAVKALQNKQEEQNQFLKLTK